jgi:hypothetical protein
MPACPLLGTGETPELTFSPVEDPSGGVTPRSQGEATIFSWDRKDGESLADYVVRLEAMLIPGPDESRVDIFDRQINHALNEAKALLRADDGKGLTGDEVGASDRLAAVKLACQSLTNRERAELLRWLSEYMQE